MDFAAERAAGRTVLLYTRQSPTWRAWPWQARALLPLLLQVVDESGAFDRAGLELPEAVALAVLLPVDVVRAGLGALLDSRTILVSDDGLVVARWSVAQPGVAGDIDDRRRQQARVRQQRAREKRKASSNPQLALGLGVTRDASTAAPPAATSSPESSRASVTVRDGHAQVGGGGGGITLCPPNTEGGASSPDVVALTLPSQPRSTAVDRSQERLPAVTTTRAGRTYIGRIASSGELHELSWWRSEAVSVLDARARARVPPFTADVAELGPGLARALDDYGPQVVRDVVRWAALETAAGRMSPRHFRALFNGDSFPQRVVELAAHVDGQAADPHTVDPALAAEIDRLRGRIESHRATLSMPADALGAPPQDIRAAIELEMRRDEQSLTDMLAASRRR